MGVGDLAGHLGGTKNVYSDLRRRVDSKAVVGVQLVERV
jgi:hypothetical protein